MSVSETLVADVRAHAVRIDHPWDARALDWPLTHDSVVVEVGGYTGRWALQIAERYAPWLLVFEPQDWAAEVCREVLQGKSAHVFRYALGTHNGMARMSRWNTDGCTLVGDGDALVEMMEIGETFRDLGITDRISLMLMNIEGYEYTLIPHMLDVGILPQRLMVQFHPPEPGGVETGRIFDRLAEFGYRIAWTYGIVLTAWERS